MFQSSNSCFFSIFKRYSNGVLSIFFLTILLYVYFGLQLQLVASMSDGLDEECSICFEAVDSFDEESVLEFTCTPEKSHFFHKQCIFSYIQTLRYNNPKQTSFFCPICRRKFLMSSLPLTFLQKKKNYL